MDVLYKAASLFKELLDTEYVFVLGKKNVKAIITTRKETVFL